MPLGPAPIMKSCFKNAPPAATQNFSSGVKKRSSLKDSIEKHNNRILNQSEHNSGALTEVEESKRLHEELPLAKKSGIKFKDPTPQKKNNLSFKTELLRQKMSVRTEFQMLEDEVETTKAFSLDIKTGTVSASKAAYGSIIDDSLILQRQSSSRDHNRQHQQHKAAASSQSCQTKEKLKVNKVAAPVSHTQHT